MLTARWKSAILLTLIFLAVALPRLAVLPRGATADEAKWSARSANFLAALGRGDLGGTYQSEHPGVTTMWAGALGLLTVAHDYANVNPGPVDLEGLGPFLAQVHGRSALDALAAGRAVMVLFSALALAAACAYAAPLLGLPAALLGGLLIAFSPFFAGHTHLLHLDGLASSFILYRWPCWPICPAARKRRLRAGIAPASPSITTAPPCRSRPIPRRSNKRRWTTRTTLWSTSTSGSATCRRTC